MDRTVKTTLAAVLPIALFLLAIPVVLTVVLFVSCERSERERAEAEAQYQELLGGELAAVVREGSGIRSTDDGFSYSALLTPAADEARGDGGSYDYVVPDGENCQITNGCIYISAYGYSLEEDTRSDCYIFCLDLTERSAEVLYAVPRRGSEQITLLSVSGDALFWLEESAAVLYDVSLKEEIERFTLSEGGLCAAGSGFAWYEEPPSQDPDGTAAENGGIVFLEGSEERILSYAYARTEETGFSASFLYAERGYAVLQAADGEKICINVRTGIRLDAGQTKQFLRYRPFVGGWQTDGQRENILYKDGQEICLDGEWLKERSGLVASLAEMERFVAGDVSAVKFADGTACICFEATHDPGWFISYDRLYFVWSDEGTLGYIGCIRARNPVSAYDFLCLLSEAA